MNRPAFFASEHPPIRLFAYTPTHPPTRLSLQAESPDADGARWNEWKADPMSFVFEEDGFAPFLDLWERAGGEWDQLRRDAADGMAGGMAGGVGAPTLVVAHGAFNRALMLQMLDMPTVGWRDDKERFIFDNCECFECEVSSFRSPSADSFVATPGSVTRTPRNYHICAHARTVS